MEMLHGPQNSFLCSFSQRSKFPTSIKASMLYNQLSFFFKIKGQDILFDSVSYKVFSLGVLCNHLFYGDVNL